MKGISYVVASILMLVITIALSGTAYMYISGVFTATIQGIEVADAYCSLGEVSLSIKNIGSTTIGTLDIEQTNPKVDDILARAFQGSIEPGKSVRYTDTCEGEESRRCIYRITPPVGRTITADVICTGRPPSLVLALHFDEGSGTEAKDSSGNGNDGTLYDGTTVCSDTPCPKWVDGKYGKGLEFDGSNDYVNVSHSESLNFGTNDFTIEAWLKAEVGSAAAVPGPISKYDEELYMTGWHLYIAPDRLLYFYAWDWNIGIADVIVTSKDSFDDGVLHHVAVVRNSTTVRMLVDGDEVGVGDTGVLINVDSIGNLTIGSIGSVGNFWSGVIDEVKIYNKALI